MRCRPLSPVIACLLGIAILNLGAKGFPTTSLSLRGLEVAPGLLARFDSPLPLPKPKDPASEDDPNSGPGDDPGAGDNSEGSSAQSGRKNVEDPTANKFAYVVNTPGTMGVTGDGWITADIFQSNKLSIIDKLDAIGVKSDENAVAVFLAQNDYDKSAVKLSLRDLLLGVWTKVSGKPVDALRRIHYNTIKESQVVDTMEYAFNIMKVNTAGNIEVNVERLGTAPGENLAFLQLLTSSPFGAGPQKMIDEYDELQNLQIASFMATRKGGVYYLDVYLGVR